jgi:hypothetical protein
MIRPTTYNITTLLLLVITIVVLIWRYRTKPDNNWPPFYYIALIAFTQKFDEVLNANYVGVAVICALLLRFEFMSGGFLRFVMYLETVALGYVIVRCLQILFGSG